MDIFNKSLLKVVDALGLISLGIVLLLNTTGIIPWEMWLRFFSFWPVWIIVAGVSAILEIFSTGKLISKIVGFVAFITLVAVSFAGYRLNTFPVFFSEDWKNVNEADLNEKTVTLEKTGTFKSIRVNIEDVIGRFKIQNSQEDNANIIDIKSRYPSYWNPPTISSHISDDVNNITIEQEGIVYRFFSSPLNGIENTYTIFDEGVPSEYEISVGAGEGTIQFEDSDISKTKIEIGAGSSDVSFKDLSGVLSLEFSVGAGRMESVFENSEIEDISVSVGAGSTEVTFDERSIPSDKASFDVGAGRCTINLPKEIGFKIMGDVGLGRITVDGEEIASLLSSSEDYKTDNYSTADTKLVIDTTIGVGSVEIILN